MGFSMVAIDETVMDCCATFETSLRKRGNYATARLSNTRAGNLTIFIAPRLPCFTSSAARSNSRRSRGCDPAPPAPSRREDRVANRVRSRALSSPRPPSLGFCGGACSMPPAPGGRSFMPATPDRHFSIVMSCAPVFCHRSFGKRKPRRSSHDCAWPAESDPSAWF